ncbi:MAG: hypothetical protein MZW92_38760 [Comamonadaceae bacterium]|nr:hypothetical protein [Comamonadaceae bacterium]
MLARPDHRRAAVASSCSTSLLVAGAVARAERGVGRPAARRRRHRAADGTARTPSRAIAAPASRCRCPPPARGARRASTRVTLPPTRRARDTRGARRALARRSQPGETVALVGPSGAGKTHGVPAAAALLRSATPGAHPHRRRRHRAARDPQDAARAHRASCRRTR